jgi:protein-tyrosine phosphatase
MGGYVDLHCHWVAGVDDGVKTVEESQALLVGLARLGFERVVATPHMRPGMFDNDRATLERGYEATLQALDRVLPTGKREGLPELGLSSEHFLDDIVFQRLLKNEALPYPGGKAVLVEFPAQVLPARVDARLFDLRCAGLIPVIAHPERYQPVWRDAACLDPLLDAGACLLLDVCAIVGKYGRAAQKAAEQLLEEEAYEAACTDSHRPSDVDEVARAIERLDEIVGEEERTRLLSHGPKGILSGSLQ